MTCLTYFFESKNVSTSEYRFYFANRYAYAISGLTHVSFIPLFYYLDIPFLAIYNFFSVFVFVLAYYINDKGRPVASTIPVVLEIMVHAVLTVYFIGWEGGFFYYVLAIIPLVFSNSISSLAYKFIASIIVAAFFLSLKFYSTMHVPIVALETSTLNTLYFMNSLFIIVGISALVHFFSRASDITEEKIDQRRYEADIANQAKSTFLANMSHELRTPLNAIIGYSEMMKDEADVNNRTQDSKDLLKISKAGNHLLNLINNILDLTKIEAGKTVIEYQAIDMSPLINDVVSTITPLIKNNNNVLTVNCADDFGYACIDQTKVKQILFNLLSNASKFTKDGKIELTLTREKNDCKESLSFQVSDSGIGIASNKLDVLFQPFVQADISTTRLYGGTGLGLTITKHFITLMGGSIDVDSVLDKGTTFSIKLPINGELC